MMTIKTRVYIKQRTLRFYDYLFRLFVSLSGLLLSPQPKAVSVLSISLTSSVLLLLFEGSYKMVYLSLRFCFQGVSTLANQ